ncbi:MAG: methionine ABC transporter ATP-binding protein [Polyangiales bacterium]
MIRLEQVSKVFQDGRRTVHAVRDVTLEVPRAKVFGVIGGSGAGKSTLIRCVNLLERPTTGRVIVDGRDLTALSKRALADARRHIGMVSQQAHLLASRTIAGNVALPLELAGVPRAAADARVQELLALVGIADKYDAWPAQLSGGQRQRATIARALANRPNVLLCDEATSALDPGTTRAILELLRELNRKLALTILLITHEMDVVKTVCDDVAIMSDGEVVEQGNAQTVFSRPQTEPARAFIRATRHLEVPEAYRARLSPVASAAARPLLRVELTGHATSSALFSQLTRTHGVDVDIVRSRTDHANGAAYGVMLLELTGPDVAVARSVEFLREQRVDVEVLGYVAADV